MGDRAERVLSDLENSIAKLTAAAACQRKHVSKRLTDLEHTSAIATNDTAALTERVAWLTTVVHQLVEAQAKATDTDAKMAIVLEQLQKSTRDLVDNYYSVATCIQELARRVAALEAVRAGQRLHDIENPRPPC